MIRLGITQACLHVSRWLRSTTPELGGPDLNFSRVSGGIGNSDLRARSGPLSVSRDQVPGNYFG